MGKKVHPAGRLLHALVVLVVLVMFPTAGETQTGEMRGTATDESGAVLPGVTVNIVNDGTGATRTLVTEDNGTFRAPALQTGTYTVTSTLTGFADDTQALILTVGQIAELRIMMKVGSFSETVTVSAVSPLIETAKSDLSAVMESDLVEELPLLNRGFIALAQLLPGGGPARSGDNRFNIQTSFGGTNTRSMYTMLIDGGATHDPIYGLPIVNVNQDAVQEFRVFRNQFDAEYSRAGTAVVSVVTKSGTNAYHGSVSYFGRDGKLNGTNFFADEKPPFKSTRVSGVVGGPIIRDKFFFFGGLEVKRTDSTQIIAMPDSNPFASQYNGQYGTLDDDNTIHAKVNYTINPENTTFFRYLRDDLEVGSEYVQARRQFNRFNNLAAEWNWVVTDTKLNTFFFNYLDQVNGRVYNTSDTRVIRPSFSSGIPANYPQEFPRKRFTFNDTFYLTAGSHSIKLGSRMAYEILKYRADWYGNGQWTFNTDSDFDINDPLTHPRSFIVGSGDQTATYKNWEIGFFIQDDWQAHDRVTLNLGLRYDFDTNLRSNSFIADILTQEKYDGLENFVTSPRGNDLNQIQPRLGLAWDTRGDGQTIVRAGYGIYSVRNRQWFNIRGQVLSQQFTAEVNDPELLQFYPDQNAVLGGLSIEEYTKTAGGLAVYLPGDNLNIPYVHNLSVGVAQVLFNNTSSLEIDYIHSVQKDLQRGLDWNLPDQGPLSQNPRPYPQFSFVTLIEAGTTSYYDALQMQFKSRTGRMTNQVSYTLAKMRSNGMNDNSSRWPDPWGTFRMTEDGLDESNRRHALSWSSVFTLPYDMTLAAIVSLRTGNPWNINIGKDLDGDGYRAERPIGLEKNAGGQESEGNLQIINDTRAAFGLSPVTMEQLTQGSGDTLLDIRFTKGFRLGESGSKRINLFLETYNLTNSVNYNNPSGVITSGSFLIRSSARDPREIQWGIKFIF